MFSSGGRLGPPPTGPRRGAHRARLTWSAACVQERQAALSELCDDGDNDCDGEIDEGCTFCEPDMDEPPCNRGCSTCWGTSPSMCGTGMRRTTGAFPIPMCPSSMTRPSTASHSIRDGRRAHQMAGPHSLRITCALTPPANPPQPRQMAGTIQGPWRPVGPCSPSTSQRTDEQIDMRTG